jgi:hypothetical protein
MVRHYRKKPVVIEAVQFTGFNAVELMRFCGDSVGEIYDNDAAFINTLEGRMRASVGDYIIKGVNGEFYPCKPDIFEKTYELV